MAKGVRDKDLRRCWRCQLLLLLNSNEVKWMSAPLRPLNHFQMECDEGGNSREKSHWLLFWICSKIWGTSLSLSLSLSLSPSSSSSISLPFLVPFICGVHLFTLYEEKSRILTNCLSYGIGCHTRGKRLRSSGLCGLNSEVCMNTFVDGKRWWKEERKKVWLRSSLGGEGTGPLIEALAVV